MPLYELLSRLVPESIRMLKCLTSLQLQFNSSIALAQLNLYTMSSEVHAYSSLKPFYLNHVTILEFVQGVQLQSR